MLYFLAANGRLLGAEEIERPVFLKNKTDNLGLEIILKMREDYESKNYTDAEIVQNQVDWVLEHFGVTPNNPTKMTSLMRPKNGPIFLTQYLQLHYNQKGQYLSILGKC